MKKMLQKNNNRNSDVIMYFIGKLAPAILGFLNIYLIAKKLSPEEYGEYALIILVLLFFQFFGSWVNQAIFYYLPKSGHEKKGMAIWFGQMTFYIAIIGSVVVVSGFVIDGVKYDIAIAAGLVFLFQIYWNYLSTYYQSCEQSKIQLIATLWQVSIQITFISLLYFFNRISVFGAVVSILIGFFTGNFWYVKHKDFNQNIISISGVSWINFCRYTKLAINYSGPLCMWFLFCQIYTFSDRFLLKWAGLSAELGRYSATRDLLLGVVSIFSMPLLMVAHPMIMRIWSERKAVSEIQLIIQRNLTIIFIVGAFFIMMLSGYGNIIFSTFFSSKYKLQNVEYVLMVGAILFSVASMYAHKSLEVTGATLKVAFLGGGVALFSVLANFILIKRFGLLGVEIVGLLSQLIYFFVASYLSRKYWNVVIPVRRISLILLVVISVFLLSKLVDMWYPLPVANRFPVPWGLIVAIVFSIFSILRFHEISDLFGKYGFAKK
ncbi:lipopolysaccharide biosynthesis protein [Collimonas humicola]|uniref:lipopolysaccharide biosynthesis protein n=1 Tax=Collimonas humicola TaxID=2825886 RepID=UPI001B8ACEEE|nr:oligosaccharide flippase family protein [Collimonas humicola]